METAVEETPTAKIHHAKARPKGRPKKDSIPPEAATAKPFPNPPRALMKGGIVSPDKFIEYRRGLGEEFLERLTFYVNREWPKLDFYQHFTEKEMEEIRQKKRAKPVKYVGQYPDIDPDNWRDEILRYHGSGDYKIYLNDTGVRGNPALKSRNICKTVVSIRDDEFPPVMDEHLHVLDWKDPINNSFIQQLRGKGVMPPGETPNKKEDTDDMATNVAVETLAELAKQGSKPPAPAADNTAIFQEMLRQSEERHRQDRELDAQRHQREIEALTKRLDAAEKSGSGDNLATTRAVIEMAKSVIPSAPPTPPDNRMHDVLLEMVRSGEARHLEELKLSEQRHAREMEAMNRRLDAEAAARLAAENARIQQNAQPGKSAIQEAIALVKALKGATEEINSDVATGTGNPWTDLLADNLPKALDLAGTALNAALKPAGTSALAPTGAAPQQTPDQQPQRQEPTAMDQSATYARMIEPHLIEALQNQVPGHRFAGFLIVNYGEPAYQYLVEQGENGVMQLLQSAPEVWGKVQRFGQHVPKFLSEFLNAPAAIEQAAMIRSGQRQSPPAARPQQRPVVVDVPASEVQQTGGGRKIINPDGTTVKTKPNGPVAPGGQA